MRNAECGMRNEENQERPASSSIPHSAFRIPHSTPREEQQGYEALEPGDQLVTSGAVELKGLLEDLKRRPR